MNSVGRFTDSRGLKASDLAQRGRLLYGTCCVCANEASADEVRKFGRWQVVMVRDTGNHGLMCGQGCGGLSSCMEADGQDCQFKVVYNAKVALVSPLKAIKEAE